MKLQHLRSEAWDGARHERHIRKMFFFFRRHFINLISFEKLFKRFLIPPTYVEHMSTSFQKMKKLQLVLLSRCETQLWWSRSERKTVDPFQPTRFWIHSFPHSLIFMFHITKWGMRNEERGRRRQDRPPKESEKQHHLHWLWNVF